MRDREESGNGGRVTRTVILSLIIFTRCFRYSFHSRLAPLRVTRPPAGRVRGVGRDVERGKERKQRE